jgi:hypothetical protein
MSWFVCGWIFSALSYGGAPGGGGPDQLEPMSALRCDGLCQDQNDVGYQISMSILKVQPLDQERVRLDEHI